MGLEQFTPEMTKSIIDNIANQMEQWFGFGEDTDSSLAKIDNPDHDAEGFETRDFGLDKCTEAAEKIFSPDVINEWPNMSPEQRAAVVEQYASEVAKAFELEEYNGVILEQLEPNRLGFNSGDGYIHLNIDFLLEPNTSPLTFIDTITHELRHQYQSECVNGFHNVPDEVRNEYAAGYLNYTDGQPWAYDPWGYMYNPLEIDSRYAGETVIRNYTSDMVNDNLA